MKNILPHFLLFIALMFLVGCTITKRRYTGGYYVSWHHKSPDARPFVQSQKPEPASNKIVCSGRSSEKNGAAQKIEISNTCKSLQPISTIPNEKWITKIVRDNLIPKIVSSTYTVTPENIPGHNQPEKDISKRDVRLSWLLCLLGVLIGLLCGILILLSLVASMGTIWSPTITIIFLLPIGLLVLSAVYGLRAILHDKKLPRSLYILVALCTLIDVVCSIIIVVEILELLFPHI